MANTIQHKRSSTSGVAPAASGLSQGELAINIADGKLYTKNNVNSVINLGVTSISGTYITPSSGNFFNYLAVNGVPVSVSGHSHESVSRSESLITTVFNETGSSIAKMTAVYINGGHGDRPTIQKAIATGDPTSAGTYGLTYETIGINQEGRVIVFGALSGVNTDQFNPSAPQGDVNGTVVYLSPTVSGGLTTTKPYAPNHIVALGVITRTHQNAGVIEVRVQNGFELDELHNVAVSGVSDGQFLYYNGSSGLWEPNTNIHSSGNNIGIGTASPESKLNIEGTATSNSLLKVGSLEFQPYALNNAWIAENAYLNGSAFVRRQAGAAGLFYFQGTEGQFRFDVSDDAGTEITTNPVWKIMSNGSMGVGSGMTSVGGSLTDAKFVVTSDGNVGIGTVSPIVELDVQGTNGTINSNRILTNYLQTLSDYDTSTNSDLTIGDATKLSHINWNIDQSGNSYFAGNVGVGTSTPSTKLDVNGNVNIDGNLTFDSYTESVVAIGNSSTSQTLSLTSGTVQTCTLTGNCTFTMPTATAGKSFTMFLNTGSGNYTASFSGVRWSDSTAPTITSTASKVDILSFISDGSYWYGSFSQNYG
jgi:hypothetical protein